MDPQATQDKTARDWNYAKVDCFTKWMNRIQLSPDARIYADMNFKTQLVEVMLKIHRADASYPAGAASWLQQEDRVTFQVITDCRDLYELMWTVLLGLWKQIWIHELEEWARIDRKYFVDPHGEGRPLLR